MAIKKIEVDYLIKMKVIFIFLLFFIFSANEIYSQINFNSDAQVTDLLFFSAVKSGKNNKIKWTVTSEVNNSFYIIEKSINGNTFEVIGYKEVNKNSSKISNYSFIDKDVTNLVNFYRLKNVNSKGNSDVLDEIKIDYCFNPSSNPVINCTDVNGTEVNDNYRGLVVILYADGTSVKMIQ